MAFLDAEVIQAGGGAAAPTPTPTSSATDDSCRTPPGGMPHFDPVVLATLYGEGKMTRSMYDRVKAGTMSIDDLGLEPEDLYRLRCQDAPPPAVDAYDPHFDRNLPPTFSVVAAAMTSFGFKPPAKPTDRAHTFTMVKGAGTLVGPAVVANVRFARQYTDNGVAVAPSVLVAPISSTGTFHVQNVTPDGYDLVTDSGLTSGIGYEVNVIVQAQRA